jgi:hypothetical protein
MGQQATVRVEALGVEIGGQVVDIAPQADTVGGDVVYAVTIGLFLICGYGRNVVGLRLLVSSSLYSDPL